MELKTARFAKGETHPLQTDQPKIAGLDRETGEGLCYSAVAEPKPKVRFQIPGLICIKTLNQKFTRTLYQRTSECAVTTDKDIRI